jgi:hypothetical protein
MKSLAVVSSGFLRNYRQFLATSLWEEMTSRFKCDVYISTWEENGYGDNRSRSYTDLLIPEDQIRHCFGDHLKFLKRLSFSSMKSAFTYAPVKSLLSAEPHVMEKYRSKFYSLKQVAVPPGYDVYFHVRFDLMVESAVGKAIVEVLDLYDASSNVVYTNRHIFGRKGCFGDIFQLMDHATLVFMQSFYDRLFDPEYLALDIPKVPEKILLHYFRKEASGKKVIEIPHQVKINRKRCD